MKFQTQVTVLGMKANKGTLDNGTAFDSTKAYITLDMDGSKANMRGQSAAEFNLGTSEEFEKYKHLPFPFLAMADMELVSTGSSQRTVVTALRPVEAAKKA